MLIGEALRGKAHPTAPFRLGANGDPDLSEVGHGWTSGSCRSDLSRDRVGHPDPDQWGHTLLNGDPADRLKQLVPAGSAEHRLPNVAQHGVEPAGTAQACSVCRGVARRRVRRAMGSFQAINQRLRGGSWTFMRLRRTTAGWYFPGRAAPPDPPIQGSCSHQGLLT